MNPSDNAVTAPSHVQVKPTSSCNLRCRTCTLWHTDIDSDFGRVDAENRLSDGELGTLIADFASWGVQRLEIADGEPFLRRGTPQFIEQAASLGLNTMAISNATLIDGPLAARLVAAGLNTLIISLDGPEALHDEIRGVPGTFEKLRQAVKLINQEKQRAGSPSPALIFHTVVSRLSYHHLTDILAVVQSLGGAVAAFRYLSRVPPVAIRETNLLLGAEHTTQAHHYTVDEDLSIPDEELDELGKQLDTLMTAGRVSPVQLAIDPLLMDLAREGRSVNRRFEGPGCPLIGDFLQVSPRGVVHPCPMLTGCGLGNVRERPVREIFEDPVTRDLLRRIQHHFPLPICPHCCYLEK
jgi:MoaA/NifB/PqqE/SkfB family radical SAM enzyme